MPNSTANNNQCNVTLMFYVHTLSTQFTAFVHNIHVVHRKIKVVTFLPEQLCLLTSTTTTHSELLRRWSLANSRCFSRYFSCSSARRMRMSSSMASMFSGPASHSAVTLRAQHLASQWGTKQQQLQLYAHVTRARNTKHDHTRRYKHWWRASLTECRKEIN